MASEDSDHEDVLSEPPEATDSDSSSSSSRPEVIMPARRRQELLEAARLKKAPTGLHHPQSEGGIKAELHNISARLKKINEGFYAVFDDARQGDPEAVPKGIGPFLVKRRLSTYEHEQSMLKDVLRTLEKVKDPKVRDPLISFVDDYSSVVSILKDASKERQNILSEITNWFTDDHLGLASVSGSHIHLAEEAEEDMKDNYLEMLNTMEKLKAIKTEMSHLKEADKLHKKQKKQVKAVQPAVKEEVQFQGRTWQEVTSYLFNFTKDTFGEEPDITKIVTASVTELTNILLNQEQEINRIKVELNDKEVMVYKVMKEKNEMAMTLQSLNNSKEEAPCCCKSAKETGGTNLHPDGKAEKSTEAARIAELEKEVDEVKKLLRNHVDLTLGHISTFSKELLKMRQVARGEVEEIRNKEEEILEMERNVKDLVGLVNPERPTLPEVTRTDKAIILRSRSPETHVCRYCTCHSKPKMAIFKKTDAEFGMESEEHCARYLQIVGETEKTFENAYTILTDLRGHLDFCREFVMWSELKLPEIAFLSPDNDQEILRQVKLARNIPDNTKELADHSDNCFELLRLFLNEILTLMDISKKRVADFARQDERLTDMSMLVNQVNEVFEQTGIRMARLKFGCLNARRSFCAYGYMLMAKLLRGCLCPYCACNIEDLITAGYKQPDCTQDRYPPQFLSKIELLATLEKGGCLTAKINLLREAVVSVMKAAAVGEDSAKDDLQRCVRSALREARRWLGEAAREAIVKQAIAEGPHADGMIQIDRLGFMNVPSVPKPLLGASESILQMSDEQADGSEVEVSEYQRMTVISNQQGKEVKVGGQVRQHSVSVRYSQYLIRKDADLHSSELPRMEGKKAADTTRATAEERRASLDERMGAKKKKHSLASEVEECLLESVISRSSEVTERTSLCPLQDDARDPAKVSICLQGNIKSSEPQRSLEKTFGETSSDHLIELESGGSEGTLTEKPREDREGYPQTYVSAATLNELEEIPPQFPKPTKFAKRERLVRIREDREDYLKTFVNELSPYKSDEIPQEFPQPPAESLKRESVSLARIVTQSGEHIASEEDEFREAYTDQAKGFKSSSSLSVLQAWDVAAGNVPKKMSHPESQLPPFAYEKAGDEGSEPKAESDAAVGPSKFSASNKPAPLPGPLLHLAEAEIPVGDSVKWKICFHVDDIPGTLAAGRQPIEMDMLLSHLLEGGDLLALQPDTAFQIGDRGMAISLNTSPRYPMQLERVQQQGQRQTVGRLHKGYSRTFRSRPPFKGDLSLVGKALETYRPPEQPLPPMESAPKEGGFTLPPAANLQWNYESTHLPTALPVVQDSKHTFPGDCATLTRCQAPLSPSSFSLRTPPPSREVLTVDLRPRLGLEIPTSRMIRESPRTLVQKEFRNSSQTHGPKELRNPPLMPELKELRNSSPMPVLKELRNSPQKHATKEFRNSLTTYVSEDLTLPPVGLGPPSAISDSLTISGHHQGSTEREERVPSKLPARIGASQPELPLYDELSFLSSLRTPSARRDARVPRFVSLKQRQLLCLLACYQVQNDLGKKVSSMQRLRKMLATFDTSTPGAPPSAPWMLPANITDKGEKRGQASCRPHPAATMDASTVQKPRHRQSSLKSLFGHLYQKPSKPHERKLEKPSFLLAPIRHTCTRCFNTEGTLCCHGSRLSCLMKGPQDEMMSIIEGIPADQEKNEEDRLEWREEHKP